MSSFREAWLASVDAKNSVLCAGLDPAEFAMGRGDKGLPPGAEQRDWAIQYLEAIAPFVAAVKPNIQYWKHVGGMDDLEELAQAAHDLGLVWIDDSKLADIGSTNEAGMYHSRARRGGAVTLAPYAGNMEEAAQQARKQNLGLITMCLMSNPEYAWVKNNLVPVQPGDEFDEFDTVTVQLPNKRWTAGLHYDYEGDEMPHVRQFVQLAHHAERFGIEGIVIGAPSDKNHLTAEELETAHRYAPNRLVLMPGVGAQGGDAAQVWQHYGPNDVIVNVGRSLMLPQGMNSTPEDQAAAAKLYKNMLNEERGA